MFDAREIFEAARIRHSLLGGRGYPFPNVERLKLYNLPGRNNFVLASAERDPFRSRIFEISPASAGNVILIEEHSLFCGRIFIRGSHNIAIVYGAQNHISPLNLIFEADSQLFYWGPDSTSNTATFALGYKNTAIIVGEDCMFSASIDVKTSDDHCIVDCDSGHHVNPGASVIFEPHVWVGLHSTVLKGVTVETGSIVAARSVVTKNVPAKTIVAGIPAEAIRKNCSWLRSKYHDSESKSQIMTLLQKHSKDSHRDMEAP